MTESFNYENWEASTLTVTIALPGTENDSAGGDVVTRERPFIIEQLKHTVIGDDGTDAEQYSIDWSIQNQKRYWKGATAPMAKLFGSTHTDRWSPFRVPIAIPGKTTLNVELTNRYTGGGGPRTVQVTFEGFERRRPQSELSD